MSAVGVRACFVAPPGWVCVARDLSQAELRLLAHYSQDPVLLKVYREGGDIHAETMAAVGCERVPAKTTNFCQVPETRVLRADLTWVRSDDVRVGDVLVGFDEQLGKHARYRRAVVEATAELQRPCFTVYTTHGSMTASAEHQWVVRGGKERRWVPTSDLKPGDALAFMAKPWSVDRSYEAGWLAGMFDGEGSLSKRNRALSVAQNPGALLDRLRYELQRRGVAFGESRNSGPGGCTQLVVRGGIAATLPLLGSVRPSRMLADSTALWENTCAHTTHADPCLVLGVIPAGVRTVIATQTNTRTLVTEGFLTHNSCVYRIGARSLAVKLSHATQRRWYQNDAQELIDGFYGLYRRVRVYHDRAVEVARARGYARTLGGFRMPLPAHEWAARRHYTENRAINYPIQGGVATILKRALVQLYREWDAAGVLNDRVVIQGQTYDEIMCLARADFAEQCEADMQRVMAGAAPELSVPLLTDGGRGPNWAAAKGG